MNKETGKITLTVAPNGTRNPESSTQILVQTGEITFIQIGTIDPTAMIGQIWAHVSIVRLGVQPAIQMAILCNGYITTNSLPWSRPMYPILPGDSIQLVAISAIAALTIYADIRIEKGG